MTRVRQFVYARLFRRGSMPLARLIRRSLSGICTAIALLTAFAAAAAAQGITATPAQQTGFVKHLLLQMAGIGRPAEETARRQVAFIRHSGLTSSDAALLVNTAASFAAAVLPINQQAAAIAKLGASATAADKQTLGALNHQAQDVLMNSAASLLSSLSANGAQRLSAIAAKQP